MAEYYCIVYVNQILLNQLSVNGHLACFHVLAIANSAVSNIWVHVPFQIRAFVISVYMPTSRIARSYSSSIFSFLRHLHTVRSEKAMAPHSSTLAWKIPWMAEPGRLQSMGLLRVGHDWVASFSLFPFTPWRRKWRPTPVFLPRESQGPGSLWGRTESDTTEVT